MKAVMSFSLDADLVSKIRAVESQKRSRRINALLRANLEYIVADDEAPVPRGAPLMDEHLIKAIVLQVLSEHVPANITTLDENPEASASVEAEVTDALSAILGMRA